MLRKDLCMNRAIEQAPHALAQACESPLNVTLDSPSEQPAESPGPVLAKQNQCYGNEYLLPSPNSTLPPLN